jgi:DNA primase
VHTPAGQLRVVQSVEPVIARAPNRFTRDVLMKKLQDRLGIDETFVRRHLQETARRRAATPAASTAPGRDARPAAGRTVAVGPAQSDADHLLRAVLLSPPFATAVLDSDALDLVGDPAVSAVVAAVAGLVREERDGASPATVERVAERLGDEAARARLARAAVGLPDLALDDAAARRMGEDALRSIRARHVDAQLAECRELAARAGDEAALAALSQRFAELTKAKSELSR